MTRRASGSRLGGLSSAPSRMRPILRNASMKPAGESARITPRLPDSRTGLSTHG